MARVCKPVQSRIWPQGQWEERSSGTLWAGRGGVCRVGAEGDGPVTQEEGSLCPHTPRPGQWGPMVT